MSGDAVPDAVRCSPNACDLVPATPVHADIPMHPFVTGTWRSALTARICPGLVPASGKFWTFVARYVASEMVPSLTKSTSSYLLPTGVKGVLVSTSVTESMMLPVRPPGAPNQKTVARMASPTWGFVGLKPLMRNVVPLAHVPFCWSSVMPAEPAAPARASIREVARSGPTDSRQPAASNAAPRSPAIVVRRDMMPPPSWVCATHRALQSLSWQSSGQAPCLTSSAAAYDKPERFAAWAPRRRMARLQRWVRPRCVV